MISVQERGKINIKELALNEPGKRPVLPFDPERDVRDIDWQNWVADLKSLTEGGKPTNGREMAMYMTILFPNRKKDLNLPTIDSFLVDTPPQLISEIRVLFPDQYELVTKKHVEPFENFINRVKDFETTSIIWDAFILYPERWEEIQEIPNLIERVRVREIIMKNQEFWHEFAIFKLNERLLDPYGAEIDNDDWKEMKNYHEEHINDFTAPDLAARMKLLSAEKIEMTDKGLVITMPGQKNVFENKGRELPERRKF
jgi:hypothetical protein